MKILKYQRLKLIMLVCLLFAGIMNGVAHSIGNDYPITKFGAVGDGKTLNTKAIQQAIDEASENGGGKVIISRGKFLTGSLQLKSKVELYLEEDAVLLGSTNPEDYLLLKDEMRQASPKQDDKSELALLLADKANHLVLSGKGTIDGQGLALALNIDSLHHIGQRIDLNYNYRRMRTNETARPKLFRFSECHDVTVTGLHLKNSACWGLSFELCSTMILDSLKITNRAYWNNDGMDITDCRNVRITNCDVDAADDGICLKSYFPGHCNDSIYIANCEIRSSASAIKFGTASYGGFKNVTIENIQVFDTFRSAIAIESVDGGDIENIRVSNIIAKNTGNAIFIRLGHRDGEHPGTVKNIRISDMNVQVPFGRPDMDYDLRGPEVNLFHNPFPSSIVGIPGHNIENVLLENVEISYPGRASKGMAYVPVSDPDRVPEQIEDYPEFSMFGELPAWAFYVRHASGIRMKNIHLSLDDADFRSAFVCDDVKNPEMEQIKISGASSVPQLILHEVTNLRIATSCLLSRTIE